LALDPLSNCMLSYHHAEYMDGRILALVGGALIKRVSLVRLRHDLSRERCLELWGGGHADVLREMPGVVAYSVDVAAGTRPDGSYDALATVRFADAEAFSHFQKDPEAQHRLLTTRAEFIEAVDAFVVDERTFIPWEGRQ
jgi:hypothetical protein